MASWRAPRLVWAVAIVAVFGASQTAGEMVVDTWSAGRTGTRPGTVSIVKVESGEGVIRVDLSALPKGARIYRARLFVQRRAVDPTSPEALVRNEEYVRLPEKVLARPEDARPVEDFSKRPPRDNIPQEVS